LLARLSRLLGCEANRGAVKSVAGFCTHGSKNAPGRAGFTSR
jgi:hypothetical protein